MPKLSEKIEDLEIRLAKFLDRPEVGMSIVLAFMLCAAYLFVTGLWQGIFPS